MKALPTKKKVEKRTAKTWPLAYNHAMAFENFIFRVFI